jgi:cathepsin L
MCALWAVLQHCTTPLQHLQNFDHSCKSRSDKEMRFIATLLLLLVLGVCSAMHFEDYVLRFNKNRGVVGSLEYTLHKTIYYLNVDKIEKHNANPKFGWKLAINKFTDMTESEIKAYKGYNKNLGYLKREMIPFNKINKSYNLSALPESVDWRTKNVVSAVKDQGGCGSCWAFSATESIESAVALGSGQLLTLAPQQIVSCTKNPHHCGGTGGCSGATPQLAFAYIASAGGMTSEDNLPYQGSDGSCPAALPTLVAGIKGFQQVDTNSYESLMDAVANHGPVSISVDANNWDSYESGIFDGCDQGSPDINHAVQLVGYGTENGKDFWIVRNSWGSGWGENGYIRLARLSSPRCGTDTSPSDGSGCDGGPKSVKVCGTCGILYDNSYPVGGFVKSASL